MEVRTKSIMGCAAFGLFLAGFLGLYGCESQFKKITDPGTAGIFKGTPRSVVLSNANGNEATIFYDFETLFLDMVDLEPLKQICFEVSLVGEVKPFQTVIVCADSLGRILNLPLLYDIGFDPVGNSPVLP